MCIADKTSVNAFIIIITLDLFINVGDFLYEFTCVAQSVQLLLEHQMISGQETLHPTQFTLHQWLTILFSLVNSCNQIGICFM